MKPHRALFCIIHITVALFLSGCSTLPPPADTVRFDTTENIVPDWLHYKNGVRYFAGKTTQPRLEFWAFEIELGNPELRIVVNGTGEEQGTVKSGRTTSFAKETGSVVAINTNPFSPVSSREGEERQVVGIAISDGVVIAKPAAPYDALVFYADGSAAIIPQSALDVLSSPVINSNIQNAVGGFYTILKDGVIPEAVAAQSGARHPRSAAGVSQNGKALYLLVVDGRRFNSVGATEKEAAIILRQLGAWDALNFDGGGSSALAMQFPDGKIRAVNTPIHNRIPGLERAVATCLSIVVHDE